jgi:transposase
VHSQQEANVYANGFVAGIDAHTRYVVVAVVNRAGERVLGPRRVQVTDRQQLLALLAPWRPLEAVVETSSSWPWLDEVLRPAGIKLVLAHAKRLRAVAEANCKTDEIDAELLARMHLAGLIPEVFVTPAAQREWETLIRHRQVLIRQRTAMANRIHGQLHQVGWHLERGRLLTADGRRWLRSTAWPALGSEQRRLVRSHLRLIREIERMLKGLDKHLNHVAATIPEVLLVKSVPGIGFYRALLLCAELLPIKRFASPRHLVSYAGLAPTSRRSGVAPTRHGPIPQGANRWVRGALVRAVVSHLQQAPESWLSRYYHEQKSRLGWPVARVAAARRLARAIHAMLRTETRWQNEVLPTAPSNRGELREPHAALDGLSL